MQFSLRLVNVYLVIQHEQHSAAYTHIAGPLHLETICLLSGGSPVPLKIKSVYIRIIYMPQMSSFFVFFGTNDCKMLMLRC